jgi:HPt (histidine-containing phosphotransfer) domain-containing protein
VTKTVPVAKTVDDYSAEEQARFRELFAPTALSQPEILTRPVADQPRQRVLLAEDGKLLDDLHKLKSNLGSVELALITTEQVEANPS